ncbi:hypothetical protein K7X08_032131 [Anisodus acutangulus]|uniref:Uncharacterized protein n=1 Tax=Anisodus acutangulus TaxID=402998 RepID=A0A9Q1MNH8_9SOLA|nr:hypothetical protein K7X08_032131 [Anisodus acutangulus]
MLRKAKAADAMEPMAIATDLGFDDNCKKVVDDVVNSYGRIDILVNNAAEQYKTFSVEELMKRGLTESLELTSFPTFPLQLPRVQWWHLQELVEKGISVNAVAPGPVWTPLIPASYSEEEGANFGKDVPMQRAAQPIEVAPSYVFLASTPESSYMTGQVLHPNGI